MDEDIYSNLALIPFTLAGFTWHSAEQYFQAAKFTDAAIIQRIQECQNPFRCASLGQTRRFKIRSPTTPPPTPSGAPASMATAPI